MKRPLGAAIVTVAVLAVPGVSIAAPATPIPAHAPFDVLRSWNETMIAGLEAGTVGGPLAGRLGAIVQSSVFDAVNGVTRHYAPVHVTPAAHAGASARAAAASAAYTALVAELPAQKPLFDQELAVTMTHLGADPGGPTVQDGLAWGATVANDIVTWRKSDGIHAVLPPYLPGTAPGDWQPTPPLFGAPLFRQFAQMTPFTMTSPGQFPAAGPPALTSVRYQHDLAEVQSLGSATSTTRTPFDTETAKFWQSDSPTAMWGRVADTLLSSRPMNLTDHARLLAQLNLAIADAAIAVYYAKNTYNFWRPITAIGAAGDPSWAPLITTPAFQEYPSGHSGLSSAAATVLAAEFGNQTRFSVVSAGLPDVQRAFTTFSSAVLQVDDARIYAGFHFRFSTIDGATIGGKVADYVLNTTLRPRHSTIPSAG